MEQWGNEQPLLARRTSDARIARHLCVPDPFRNWARTERLEQVARALLAQSRSRSHFLPEASNEDPQWLMLLELFIAARSHRKVSVSNLCVAAGVPATTALRHVGTLERNGLLIRSTSPGDRRVAHVRLAKRAQEQIESFLSSIAPRWQADNDDGCA
jgi:DNA-binding MarR family transcriptional regulator